MPVILTREFTKYITIVGLMIGVSFVSFIPHSVAKEKWQVAVNIQRHKPANIFFDQSNITFDATIKTRLSSEGVVTLRLTDYFQRVVREIEQPLKFKANTPQPLPVELGKLPNGYYELDILTHATTQQDEILRGATHLSFGVSSKSTLTAKQFRDQGHRMGLKMWYIGDIWWRRGATWDENEVTEATVGLGLQWTRALMQMESHLSTRDLLNNYPMNAIIKVESFPEKLFDTETYGPLDEWVKKHGRAWMKKTLPRKVGYQAWLREKLKDIPQDQQVFEVWNEAWDKMSAKDLAMLSNWIAEVILDERPDAIIGPNLMGKISKYSYDTEFIRAGGMKGMRMVALHPYDGSENRAWLREYKAWLKQQTGQDIDIYVTEYGSHSTPDGPAKRTEEEQAQRVVRQSLSLYAEDVKAFTPHWMGQREHNRTYHEHWFGFYRLNHQPKPVLMAFSNCAGMIDGGKYRGDVWYGPGMGAMVFTKNGQHVLALFTKEGTQSITLDTHSSRVETVDMVGRRKMMTTDKGKLSLVVSQDVTYVVGLGDEILQEVSTDLRPDRFPQPAKAKRNVRTAKAFNTPPTIDGKLQEWDAMTQLAMQNPKVNGADASGIAYMAWDSANFYIALDMRDNQILNRQVPGKLYRDDSLEIFLSTEPRAENSGYGPNDFQFFAAPTHINEQPLFGHVADREAGDLVAVKGAQYHILTAKMGWAAEIAIPWDYLNQFTGKLGARLAVELRVNDTDTSHKRWKIDSMDAQLKPGDPTTWSIVVLK